jgi:hypothetical protein
MRKDSSAANFKGALCSRIGVPPGWQLGYREAGTGPENSVRGNGFRVDRQPFLRLPRPRSFGTGFAPSVRVARTEPGAWTSRARSVESLLDLSTKAAAVSWAGSQHRPVLDVSGDGGSGNGRSGNGLS